MTTGRGPSAEMRRFSAGIRVVTALMCTVLLLAHDEHIGAGAMLILVLYCTWAAWLLWVEATERSSRINGVWPYWIDVAWSCLVLKVFSAGTAMMIVTLVHPVVLTSIGFGVAPGVTLALAAALGLLYAEAGELTQLLSVGWRQALPTLLVLTLVPAAAVVARPMSVLRHRLALIDELGAQLDPRRGLESICAELVEKLRIGTQADVVTLVLPSKFGAPAMLASREDGSFRAKTEVHTNLEQLLEGVPSFPVSYIARHWWDPRRRLRSHGKQPLPRGLTAGLAELARTLDVRSLHVVPLLRYTREHGHFVVGYADARSALQDMSALSGATAELLRIVEQAALVDQLQDESASHERARIGRDLHDSAIQPYLGLKYAVECVALRIPRDNPARAEVESLATLVNSEVSALRELISGLRTGNQQGDNALVPAVRRQARRFALLFGIEVEVECADYLPTTRALASALFHMVNEALNNVRKHTAAQHVRIGLAIDGAMLRLVVRDDAGTVRGRPVSDFCPGSLSERAAELGGSLTVSRPDGVNTELVIQVPL
ncbi:MAG TPA: histidine kinase [Burkholderiaceae bacterium]